MITMRTVKTLAKEVTGIALGLVAVAGIAGIFLAVGGLSAQDDAMERFPIVQGAKVTIEYRITLPDETEIPSEVVDYVQGEHEIPPAVESALSGMKPGEEKRIGLSAEQAFGAYDASKRVVVWRDTLPADIEVGSLLESDTGLPVTVAAVTQTVAVLDFNHPFAGLPIVLDVVVLRVQGELI